MRLIAAASLMIWLLAALARPAGAVQFETFIVVETEEDLYDLRESEQIGDETFQTLLELFRRGIELNTASREDLYSLPNLTLDEVDKILEYRGLAGRIDDPAALVQAGILSEEQLLAIAAFFVVVPQAAGSYATDGWLRGASMWSQEDDTAPPFALQGRVRTYRHLTIGGAAVLTRRRLDSVVYDPSRDALVAGGPGVGVHAPKLFAKWETATEVAIAGSYRIGFGQRLTFDSTDRYTPNGIQIDDVLVRPSDLSRECIESQGELPVSPCTGAAGDVYVTPDFRWREGMRGVAAGFKEIKLPQGGWAQAYAFASLQTRSIYQYEIYDRRDCADPRNDMDPACSAPDVFKEQGDALQPTSRYSFSTLPDMYNELLGGGNIAWFKGRRTHVGITGYGATIDWLVDGMDLDFQEWSHTPGGGPFGAVGVDGAWGRDWLDIAAEATRSFDSMIGGGGDFGAIARGTARLAKKSELELVLRYYGEDFANPYGGAIAAPDETDGFRARDEIGGRVKYTTLIARRLGLRGLVDLWTTPSEGTEKVLVFGRADLQITDQVTAGVWTDYQDKDVGRGGMGQCFEVSTEEDEAGEPIPCAGTKLRMGGRVRVAPWKTFWLVAQAQMAIVDDPGLDPGNVDPWPWQPRRDLSAWVLATWKPRPGLRLRARVRYVNEAIGDATYLEDSIWTYLAADVWETREYALRLRYDTFIWLDDRASSMTRVPNPEHWLRAEVEWRF